MTYETVTSLAAAEVIGRAKDFFAHRVPHNAAYPEKEGPGWLVLRGQGGEEVALVALPDPLGTRVRGSSLLFDQAVDRFLSSLPPAASA